MNNRNKEKNKYLHQEDIHEDKLEQVQYVSEQIKTWTENADNKVSVSFGVFTAAFGIITFLSEQYIQKTKQLDVNKCLEHIHMIILIISFVFISLAFCFYIKAIIPNIKVSTKHSIKYPVFFGNIQKMTFDEYKSHTMNGTVDNFIDEIIYENWINSAICFKKMKNYRLGVFFSSVSVFLAILCFCIRYYMYI